VAASSPGRVIPGEEHSCNRLIKFVEALRYKPKGQGFESQWGHWDFSFTQYFRLHYDPVVDSACERNEYEVSLKGVKATGAYCDNLATFLFRLS
jgi:hypothetical protein